MRAKKVFIIFLASILLLVVFALMLSVAFQSLQPGISLFGGNVALISIEGEISNEEVLFLSNKTAFDLVDEIEMAENDPTVSAILLEINSSGGSPVATRQLTEKILSAGEKKPVVAWISDVGASAGYYIAASSDLVVADPDSLTGSIGAISVIPDYSELFEKLGIEMRVFKSGEFKDMGSPFRDINEEEREMLNEIIQQATENFKEEIKEFRGERLDTEEFEKIADGRILTGKQAQEIGLVDELGTRNYALKRAGEMAGIEKPVLKSYELQGFSLTDLFSRAGYALGTGFREGLSSQNLSIES